MTTRKPSKSAKEELHLSSLSFAPKSEIAQRGPRNTPVSKLPMWADLEKVFVYAKEHGVTPFEEAIVIDIPAQKGLLPAEVKKQIQEYKNVNLTVASGVRKKIKEYDLSKSFQMLVRESGNKIYLVGLD